MRRVFALALSLVLRGADGVCNQFRMWLHWQPPRAGVVLYYHGIKPQQRARFARQMDEIVKRSRPFPAGSPEAMVTQRWNVAITFDDGYESVAQEAAPELAKRCIPYTIFVPSGSLGQRPTWVRDPRHPGWDERVLSPAALRSLAGDPLATVGSHSVTHKNMLQLDPDEAERELIRSKADLESSVQIGVDLFSFPHGEHSAELIDRARRAGYRRVYTVEPAIVDADGDPFTIGRIAADPNDWNIEFRLKIAGAYRWRCYYHRWKQSAKSWLKI